MVLQCLFMTMLSIVGIDACCVFHIIPYFHMVLLSIFGNGPWFTMLIHGNTMYFSHSTIVFGHVPWFYIGFSW